MTMKDILIFLALATILNASSVFIRNSFGFLEGYIWTFIFAMIIGLLSGYIVRLIKE